MAYDRETKRWTRKARMGRGDKASLARAPFRRDTRDNFGSTLKRAKREAGKVSTLNKIGKKGRANARALAVFKKECVRLGIERCEVRYEGCTGEPDTWAHGRKRRMLKPGELETFAVVACLICHRQLDEGMSHEQMAVEVSRIINLRPERYLDAA